MKKIFCVFSIALFLLACFCGCEQKKDESIHNQSAQMQNSDTLAERLARKAIDPAKQNQQRLEEEMK